MRRAFVDGPPPAVYVIAEAGEAAPVELAARAVLTRHGLSARDADLHLCHAAEGQPRRRVRFLSARVDSPRAGRARASVVLEWGGTTFEDEVEGESGPALELRLAALATLRTLEGVIGSSLSFHLVGIRSLRAFDTDLVVVMLRAEQLPGSDLVGASLASESPYRSAALAVLNATNRVLGNYLSNEG